MTSATPLEVMRSGSIPELGSLLTGIRPGSLGESAVILIVLAAIYLIYTKTASWRIILSTFLSFTILSTILFFCRCSRFFSAPGIPSFRKYPVCHSLYGNRSGNGTQKESGPVSVWNPYRIRYLSGQDLFSFFRKGPVLESSWEILLPPSLTNGSLLRKEAPNE